MPLHGEYEPSPADYVREQVETYERTHGEEANTMGGKPVVIVTTLGAKSGKLRKAPLMRVEHGGNYAIVASMGGAPTHPVWYHNVRANPLVELQDGGVKKDYIAHESTGEERQLWWERATDVWPDYNEYQKKTTREIPVIVLEPAG
ncbi:nitroreductase family deazaflavin-dependent oxidoreductase [Hoyosella sp. YIM 151337]|uniref:nitroreductase family deazaflavin-dependent oxidoreductase n=1 Tax=Hoyosella sp. YIM 151337 TaxID=2992742 RepID=UPI0022364A01|nr:nitroreductase family deazaflavin-dependent oxidoreductase [Hoyosella sp. YIM 151337]MCW4355481.1 nitroreductase family deazaflavin-dependent oxidoreductase [Hoyosella sp. YIM 151337]